MPQLILVKAAEDRLPLHSAVIGYHPEVVAALLHHKFPASDLSSFTDPDTGLVYQAGFNLNARDSNGETALHFACRYGYVDIAKLLLQFSVRIRVEKKFSIKIKDEKSDHGPESLELDSELDCETNSGQNTLSKQSVKNSYHVLNPVSCSIENSKGFTPLHIAMCNQQTEVVKLLLQLRGSPSNTFVLNEKTYSMAVYALENGNNDILELMLCSGVVDIENKALFKAFFSEVS